MIEVQDLGKSFGSVVAVDGLSFKASNGSVTALLGPNGAGKTTTLRAIYGLIQPDRGQVLVDGIDVAANRLEAQARLGVLPESRGLYSRLTARDHIRYFAALRGLHGAEAESRCSELIELLDMGDIAGRRSEGFSHGERTKVALSSSLVHGPPNVILDEPTNGLDVMSTRTIRGFIRQLRDEGKCVLFSSHVMQEVAAVCDSIVIVASGRLVAHSTPEGLLAKTGQDSLEDAFVKLTGRDSETA